MGTLGSPKPNCDKYRDYHTHAIMYEDCRYEIRRLEAYIKSIGYEVYQIQTDAVFIQCESESHRSALKSLIGNFSSKWQFKSKDHDVLYHFKNANTYLSITGDVPCIKGFCKDKSVKEWFTPYVRRFLLDNDKLALADALLAV